MDHIGRTELNKPSPLEPSVMGHRDLSKNLSNSMLDPVIREQQFQQQILQLKHQQQLQQQYLLQQFQHQQQQLAEQHEKQLQEHIKTLHSLKTHYNLYQCAPMCVGQDSHHRQEYLEQQKQLEEEQRLERERREKEKLEALKKKEKHEQSAIASSEVKQKLQEFVLSKKHREAAANSANNSPPHFRNWATQHSSIDQSSPPQSNLSPPYRHPLLGKYDDDFPLRKTASEPNLKVRSIIKQKVIERRSSPLLRRKEKGPVALKRKHPLTIEPNSNSDSGPNSPPSGGLQTNNNGSVSSLPASEEQRPSSFHLMKTLVGQGSIGDLNLYSSPSMPNISLGRPPAPTNAGDSSPLTEAEMRAMAAARLGMPLTSHVLPNSMPFYPSLPVIDGEFTPPTSPSYIHQQMKALEQARTTGPTPLLPGVYPGGITDAQVAQLRLHRTGHRPLSRTQSAPLPLGHPMLQPQNLVLQQQHEQYLREKQLYEQHQHNLLKQQIRQTVLTRAGSKNHVENVEEETEAAVAQEMKDSDDKDKPEVIDLTDKKENGDSELVKQQKEREAFLQQQRDLMRPTITASEGSAFTPRPHVPRPLSRALSSPLVTLSPSGTPVQDKPVKHIFTTGLVYDSLMLKHQCICGDNYNHPEHAGRLQSIWARLQETQLVSRCERLRARKATLEEIQSCHSEAHTLLFGTSPLNRQKLDMNKLVDLPLKSFVMLPCGGIGVDSDTTWNDLHSASATRMAAGCVTELALKVAGGEIKNGFAVVRPPGHHAEPQQAMGFCFFNSIAIATKLLRQRLKTEKILIVDWDVHHGNGLQQIFYDDPHVLYISLHRHDEGNFFPGTGAPEEVGVGEGIGFNVNVAWSGSLNPPMGDAEYLAAFRTIVMPIAKDFAPDIVLVAAGFDAAAGHPPQLGGYLVTPACFGHMTKQLMTIAGGKIVLALEGGYDLPAICDCSEECVKALLGDEPPPLKEEELTRKPCQAAIDTFQKTISSQAQHWPCVKRWAHTVGYSLVESQRNEKEEAETVTALASLSMAVGRTPMSEGSPEPSGGEEPMDQDK